MNCKSIIILINIKNLEVSNRIFFIDIETDPRTEQILDIGAIDNYGHSFHKSSVLDFKHFLKDTKFVCGHNWNCKQKLDKIQITI